MTSHTSRAPAGSSDLAGRAVRIVNETRSSISFEFGDDMLRWSYRAADDDAHGDEGGTDPYLAFRLSDGLYLATFHASQRPSDAVCTLFDFTLGRVFSVVMVVDAADQSAGSLTPPMSANAYIEFGTIDGTEVTGEAPTQRDGGWLLRDGIHVTTVSNEVVSSAALSNAAAPRAAVVVRDGSREALRVEFGVPAGASTPEHVVTAH